MDMPNVDETSSAIKSFNPFSFGFDCDPLAAGLLSLHRWRVLTTQQFADATGWSYAYVTRDMKRKLTGHKLLRVMKSLRHDYRAGRPPVMFGLLPNGYKRLAEAVRDSWFVDDVESLIGPYRRLPHACKWGTGRPHVYAIIDAAIAVERAARTLRGCEVVEIIPEFTRWKGQPNPTLEASLPIGKGLRADMALVLRRGGQKWVVFVEVDRASKSLTTNDADRLYDTIEGCARKYWSYLQTGKFIERFGVSALAFQVLFITTTKTRAANMAANIKDLSLPPVGLVRPEHVFLTSTMERVQADFFGQAWDDLDGRPCRLIGEGAVP